ncbi:hypothetical protein J4456_03110 [Candidatus Pacearchaeota archaeon]|nr:hypothetical protein [Candidatus Pacearchaeota archaeon]
MKLETLTNYFSPINDYKEIKETFQNKREFNYKDVGDIANNIAKSLMRGSVLGAAGGLLIAPFTDNNYASTTVLGVLVGLHLDFILNANMKYVAKMIGDIK